MPAWRACLPPLPQPHPLRTWQAQNPCSLIAPCPGTCCFLTGPALYHPYLLDYLRGWPITSELAQTSASSAAVSSLCPPSSLYSHFAPFYFSFGHWACLPNQTRTSLAATPPSLLIIPLKESWLFLSYLFSLPLGLPSLSFLPWATASFHFRAAFDTEHVGKSQNVCDTGDFLPHPSIYEIWNERVLSHFPLKDSNLAQCPFSRRVRRNITKRKRILCPRWPPRSSQFHRLSSLIPTSMSPSLSTLAHQ